MYTTNFSLLTEFDQELYDKNRRQEGAHENAVENAKNLLKEKIPVETIVRCIGLSLDEVQKLAEEIEKEKQ